MITILYLLVGSGFIYAGQYNTSDACHAAVAVLQKHTMTGIRGHQCIRQMTGEAK